MEPTNRSHSISSRAPCNGSHKMSPLDEVNIVYFIGLFCKRDLLFKEPTNRSHSITARAPCNGSHEMSPLDEVNLFVNCCCSTLPAACVHQLHVMCQTSSFVSCFTRDITHIYGTWLVHMGHDLCIWDMCAAPTCHVSNFLFRVMFYTWHNLYIYTGHELFTGDMPHACVWLIYMSHDSCIWDMTQSYITWLMYMGHDACICDDSCIWDMTQWNVTWLMYMGHDACICDDSCIWDMTQW